MNPTNPQNPQPPSILVQEIQKLETTIKGAQIPPDLAEKAMGMVARLYRLTNSPTYSSEYESTARYIDWIMHLPWKARSQDNLDLGHAKKVLDSNHYGLNQVKDRILEYMSVLSLRAKESATSGEVKVSRAPILLLVGLVGTGKTTLSQSIAEAMGRKFERIPFGGMGDSLTLRGQSRSFADAEPGAVLKALRRVGTKNPVILLDEIDRVSESARADIMGVLIELLDPGQNYAFTDHFLDYPFDLSEVLFIGTCNNTTNISTAVMDRLEPLQMPSYTDEEKIAIAKSYVFPRALVEAGIKQDQLIIEDPVWEQIVRPLGFDSGIRTLERTVAGICRKVARTIVEGKVQAIVIKPDNVKQFLPTW